MSPDATAACVLHLKVVAPLLLEEEEVRRRQRRYDRLAGSSIAVTLRNLSGPRAPRRLDTREDIERSAELVQREIEGTDPLEFDAVLPDCVLDPCVGELAQAPLPLYGILRSAASALVSTGASFAAVTRNRAIGDELARKLDVYGLASSLTSVHVLDADFCLIADDEGWMRAVAPILSAIERTGARYVLNGCSAVDIHPVDGVVRAVDPTGLALGMLAAGVHSGIVPARRLAADETCSDQDETVRAHAR